jgi:hypothetical protein
VQAADVDDSRWARTLERITGSVVSIQIDQVRAFDTESNSSGQATGFIVDAKRGLILQSSCGDSGSGYRAGGVPES